MEELVRHVRGLIPSRHLKDEALRDSVTEFAKTVHSGLPKMLGAEWLGLLKASLEMEGLSNVFKGNGNTLIEAALAGIEAFVFSEKIVAN